MSNRGPISNDNLNTYAFHMAVYVWESARQIQEDEDPSPRQMEEMESIIRDVLKFSEKSIRTLPEFFVYFTLQFSGIVLDAKKDGEYLSIYETGTN